MAFCPNCGTPNTDQADKCMACGFELAVPKQKAKFKGTIMMSGLKAPTSGETEVAAESAQGELPPAPPASPAASPAPSGTETGKNPSYAKTMMGHAPVVVPPRAAPPTSTPPRAPTSPNEPKPASLSASSDSHDVLLDSSDLHDAPELTFDSPSSSARPLDNTPRGPAPRDSTQRPITPPPPPRTPRDSIGSGSFVGSNAPRAPNRTSVGGYDSTMPPSAPPSSPKPGKIIAIGCAVALALFCVVGGILYYVVGAKLKALLGEDDSSAEASAWQASIVQSLAQVGELCKTDCTQAGVYFHPQKEAALLGEAKALTPERLLKLSDSAQTEASMLDGTDDEELATKLGLDPQQCARVTMGNAKVVSCSVPDPTGKPSVLRIVHLGGIGTL